MLKTQVDMYSVDTGHFYSNHEKYLHDMNCKYRRERNYINNKLPAIEQQLREYGFSEDELRMLKNGTYEFPHSTLDSMGYTAKYALAREYMKWNELIVHKRAKAKESKRRLLTLLANRVTQNERTDGKDHIRCLRDEDLRDNNIISVFESSLTRTIGINPDELTDDLLVVQIYYFDVFKDLVYYGFMYNGEKYHYYTSSAGQIRKKKAVFIKESVWNRIEKTIMCGLTIDRINAKGGNNVNKHLAYLALSNSATDVWEDFDIDRCIVIDDFETEVYGEYDFINDVDYSITRTSGNIPIAHTDGAGMMLPSVMDRNTMFRAPWIKGLLGVFDFKHFIEVNGFSPLITDIYGVVHDVYSEDIRIIFTKSQFKMAKFYESWDEYKSDFKKYGCQAGLCNTEEYRIKNARINYQMLQTLTDVTDDEVDRLTAKSFRKVNNLCTSQAAMMDALGINVYNNNPSPFQRAVKIYPALLNDTYAKDIIREIKDSLIKKYRSGKLEINGKFLFILPDFYAACMHWFGHEDKPEGLLADGEVYCGVYRNYKKLDLLRSPHLYKEHAVRNNAACISSSVDGVDMSEWFTTNAVYTSTHDLISKILQFDVDGDKSLVVADGEFVAIAERNMEGILPLYYEMKKAEPSLLNNENIYKGLNAAFTGGNIGIYSNNISKIWNSEVFISGSEMEKQYAVDCVKRLCCQNNFVIDYAKTLYKPEFPTEINNEIRKFTNRKLPAFFKYAKDKDDGQVEKRNGSFVNRIYERIPSKKLNTKGLRLENIDYRKMMSNINIVCSLEVSELYDKLNRQYRYMVNMKDEYTDNLHYVARSIRRQFSETGYSDVMITDMLVRYLYGGEKRGKQLLWFCYGSQIVTNLERNIGCTPTKYVQCVDCGEWFEVGIDNKRSCRCFDCQRAKRLSDQRNIMQKLRSQDVR